MKMISKKQLYRVILLVLSVAVHTQYAMNVLQPYDTLIRMPLTNKHRWQLAMYAEGSVGHAHSFAECGKVCSPLLIWQPVQNALAMLQGFAQNSSMSALRNELNADNNGTRGLLSVTGDLKLDYSLAWCARANFFEQFSIGAYLPMMSMQLSEVCWHDQTQDITDADVRVHELLTNPDVFFTKVCELGGLELGGWKRTGLGDLVVMLEWFRDFPQPKPLLKNVFLNWRLGLNLPTGLRADQDKLCALPFGYDGATGLIFGLGLELRMGSYIKCGVDVQLTQLFDTIRDRRIKTDAAQTELLLLEKTEAHKDFGLVQRFNLDIEALYRGFSCKFGYQYIKQGEATLSLVCNEFSDAIANTAESLQPITMHQLIVNASYDFEKHLSKKAWAIPYVSLYARVPFNGTRAVEQTMIGGVLGVSF